MPTITTKDGPEIFYKDWGSGQPIVFSQMPTCWRSSEPSLTFGSTEGMRQCGVSRGHSRT